jgi:hypothetical protein
VPIWRRCKKGESGLINLCFEDEAGFVMTLSPSYSWSPLGQPISVAHEAPQGRRINVLGAYFSHWPLAGRFVSALYATLPIMPLCLLCHSAYYATLPKSKAKKHRKTPAQIAQAHGLTADQVGPIDAARFLSFVWRVAGRLSLPRADHLSHTDPPPTRLFRRSALSPDRKCALTNARVRHLPGVSAVRGRVCRAARSESRQA